ncbi:uncharacterized protein LOC125050031 isoform X4 [Pieris napi]|uniref:uncharacterized protein LOC125050031 isoform X4 n=1 Tax=Pieris napi TaxID=78633 RepID=UPI001FB9C722|nr:uncharacterized protein LOC125050031 isoform X4 [Pieris napi]
MKNSPVSLTKTEKRVKLVPPDGGWGWIIVLGTGLSTICGTLLIQPVEWHMKKIEEEVVVDEKVNLLEESKKNDELNNTAQRATSPIVNDDGKQKLVPDFHSHRDLKSLGDSKSNGHLNGTSKSPQNTKSGLRKLYELFDISLLKNPRFLNVIIGTALTSISLQNFSMLYPLFLQNAAGMNKQETANCMSAVAFADIIGRLSIPQLQAKFNISARMTLIITCIWVFIVRQILAYQTDIYVILVLSSMYGIGRSMVIVARNITISEQCQVEQVASAVGLGMLSMGLLTPPIGYFLGWVRDFTEDYIACISAQNAILILFLIMWIPDMLHQYYQKKKEKVDETEMT